MHGGFRKRSRVGPWFQGRFRARLVAPNGSHLQVSLYVHFKPVRAGLEDSSREAHHHGEGYREAVFDDFQEHLKLKT